LISIILKAGFEIENPSFCTSNNQNSELVSLEEKKFEPRLFDAELFELRQNLASFAFSNRPFYTPKQYNRKAGIDDGSRRADGVMLVNMRID